MSRFPSLRAWVAVHASRPALITLLAAAVGSIGLAEVSLSRAGFVLFVTPISALMLLPVVAGVGVAVACQNTAALALPDPVRAVLARAAWVLVWTVLATLAANAGLVAGARVDAAAVVRNVLLVTALGLAMTVLGQPQLAWLPAVAYGTACMLLGSTTGGEFYWWAVMLTDRVTTVQAVVVTGAFVTVAGAYVLLPHGVLRYRRRG